MSNLAIACEMSLNDWLATFPDVIPEAERSKKHEKWKKNLFNKMRDDHYHRFTTRTVKVLVVAAILCALLLTAFVIPSSREFILDEFGKHSTYQLTEDNNNSITGEIKVGYIPEGYEYESSNCLSKHTTLKYKSNNGESFTIFKYSSAVEVDFDTEKAESEEIFFKGINYVYCTGNYGMNSIVWVKNDYVYKIDASLNKDEMLKIAKTVE